MERKGWIALDIDGTITLEKYSIPDQVLSFLTSLHNDGWNICFATGRPFAFAEMALSKVTFPYIFLAQNGSMGMQMPERKVLFKKYMTTSVLPFLENAYQGIYSDYLIYSGFEKADFCYWRPKRMPPDDIKYIQDLQKRQKENWQAVSDYGHIGSFPLIKCFGPQLWMQLIAERLKGNG